MPRHSQEVSGTFSQFGEDRIVRDLFDDHDITCPSYLDIGAFHPFHFSNTALLHQQGSRGINVEPHPERIDLFRRYRPQDFNLAVGVAAIRGTMTYYDFGDEKDIVNTFSANEAKKSEARGHTLTRKIDIPVVALSQIVSQYWCGEFPDFLTIDAEGLDKEILSSMTHLPKNMRPKVICAETLGYTDKPGEASELTDIIEILCDDGYRIHNTTEYNTIFERIST